MPSCHPHNPSSPATCIWVPGRTRLPQAEHLQLGQCRLPPAQVGQASRQSTSGWATAHLAGQCCNCSLNSKLCCTWLPCRYCVILLCQAEVLHDLTLASAGQATQPACTGMGNSSSSLGTSLLPQALPHALPSMEPASNAMFHDVLPYQTWGHKWKAVRGSPHRQMPCAHLQEPDSTCCRAIPHLGPTYLPSPQSNSSGVDKPVRT